MSTVLVYHTISSPAEPLPGEIDISPEAFARQLDWLAGRRSVVPLIETMNRNPQQNRVAITFDDGFRDNLTVAVPLLEKYSMPATVFVTAGFVGNDAYLSAGELHELSQHPLITIGAHGLWHRHFNLLSNDEARRELTEGRQVLEEIIKQKVDLMAWPYGECDSRLEDLAAECGYRASWSVWKGSNSQHSRWRVPLGRGDNLPRFVLKVSGLYALEARRHRFINRLRTGAQALTGAQASSLAIANRRTLGLPETSASEDACAPVTPMSLNQLVNSIPPCGKQIEMLGKTRKPFAGEKIRVLRVSHSSLTPALRERERALARNYPDVDLQVVTARKWREAEVDVAATPDDMFPVFPARTCLSKHVQLFAWNTLAIIAALRRHRPHLIDLNHEPFSVGCAQMLMLCDLFAPQAAIVLQTAQNIYRQYPPPFCWSEQRSFRRVDAAYACSETTREVMRAKGFHKPMAIIPFGVDSSIFTAPARPVQAPKKTPTIGYVGRMLPGKGLNVLAEALLRLVSADWKLLVVGDGPEKSAFAQQLREQGLIDRVQFAGAIRYDEVPAAFQQMDLFVMPTETTSRIREQFGRVLVEAMASGVPVIGSTSGAIPEVIQEAGLIFPEGDAKALAGAIDRLLSDPILRAQLARAGHERVERQYSWNRVADLTYEFYRRILRSQFATSLDQKFEFAER